MLWLSLLVYLVLVETKINNVLEGEEKVRVSLTPNVKTSGSK